MLALRRAGVKSHRIEGKGQAFRESIKTLLCSGFGIVGGWDVDDQFECWTPDDGAWDGPVGDASGHCMCVLDYPEGLPRLVNSWGLAWGERGLVTFTWEQLERRQELWAIDFVPIG
jgi:hypothetical protein